MFRAFATKDLDGVSSMALYKRARFAADDLNDYALAKELVTVLKQKDAEFAKRHDVDALIK